VKVPFEFELLTIVSLDHSDLLTVVVCPSSLHEIKLMVVAQRQA
jgi:hypothetical protein